MLELSGKLHGSTVAQRDFTMKSMKDHADEIRMLLSRSDEHWKAETTDLGIHCLLLLRGAGMEAEELDELLDRRLERFREKISEALRDKQHKATFRKGVYGEKDSGH